jgi:outer membrane lipoprotein-sorting protein
MRKIGLLACGVCLCLAWGLYGQEGGPRAIIDKAIKAHGGAKKLEAIKAMHIKGKGKIVSPMELPFTLELSIQPPDKLKANIDIEVNNMTIAVVQVINGKKGWASAMGMTKELEADELKEAREQFHVEKVTSLIALKDKSYKLSALGDAKVGDREAVGVQVTKKGLRDVNLYFDKKTHLLLKSEYRAIEPFSKQEVTQEKLYLNYKAVGGIQSPTKMVVNNDGKKFMDIEITETTPMETPFEDSVFAKPS